MSSLKRFLSFVPPILLFVFPAFSQIQGKLEKLSGTETYQVSIIPTMDISLPLSATSSAQITLRAQSGKLNLTNFQSITGDWELQSQYISPIEAPDFDYFRFFLINPIPNISYVTGVEKILFTFKNGGGCTGIELIDNLTDPFASNNSLNVNAENYISTFANPGGNTYEGNSISAAVYCPGLGVEVTAAENPVPCNGDVTTLSVKALEGVEPYTVVYTHLATGATANKVIPVFEGTTTFDNMPAGDYKFTISDSKDSVDQTDFKLLQPNPLVVELEPFPATCSGSEDGAVRVKSIFGLNGPDFNAYQYFWNIDPTNSNIEIDSLNSGAYSVTVVDANGCTVEESALVGIYNELLLPSTIVPISCFGENDGIIDITPLGLNPPYSFQWSPNANTALDQSAAWMLGAGEYHVTVTAENGICTKEAIFNVEEPAQIEVDYMMVEPVCHGDKAFLNILAVENTQGNYDLLVDGQITQLSDFEFEVEAGIPLNLTIIDSHDCEIKEDFIIPDKPELIVDLGEDVTIKYGESYYIDAEVYPLTGVDLVWSSVEWLDCDKCPNPTASPLETRNYQLRITDDNGCYAEDDILIAVNKSRDVFIPNAFSPNQDGINDVFRPYGGFEVVQIKSMLIFDRWGGLIYSNEEGFKLDDDETGWNGLMQGKELDTGTYLYTMNIEFIDGEIILFAGEVNLIK
ncbi:MAG: gliding motility-associated C-terminal domain-containing protein [Saprospiraceae bacterium]